MRKRNLILIVIFFMCIGFASITISLVSTGVISFSTNKDDFEVIFHQASIDHLVVSKDVISPNKKSISYETPLLSKIGDTSTLEYVVLNNSTQYDAIVNISCSTVESDFVDFSYNPSSMEVRAGAMASGSVTVTLKKITLTDTKINFDCTLNATAKSKTSPADKYINIDENYDVVVLGDSIMNGYRNNDHGVDYYLIQDGYATSSLKLAANSSTLFYSPYVDTELLIYDYQVSNRLFGSQLYVDKNATIVINGGINDILYNLKYANYSLGVDSMEDVQDNNFLANVMSNNNLFKRIFDVLYGLHATFPNAKIFYVLPRDIPLESTKEYYKTIPELNETIAIFQAGVQKWDTIMHYDNVIIINPNDFVLDNDLVFNTNPSDNVHWSESAYIKLKNIIEGYLDE